MGSLSEFQTYAINYKYQKRYEKMKVEKEIDDYICENSRKIKKALKRIDH